MILDLLAFDFGVQQGIQLLFDVGESRVEGLSLARCLVTLRQTLFRRRLAAGEFLGVFESEADVVVLKKDLGRILSDPRGRRNEVALDCGNDLHSRVGRLPHRALKGAKRSVFLADSFCGLVVDVDGYFEIGRGEVLSLTVELGHRGGVVARRQVVVHTCLVTHSGMKRRVWLYLGGSRFSFYVLNC